MGEKGQDESRYYADYLAELEEIRRHKWIESQQAGKDVGFEYALVDWVTHHRDRWRQERSLAPNDAELDKL